MFRFNKLLKSAALFGAFTATAGLASAQVVNPTDGTYYPADDNSYYPPADNPDGVNVNHDDSSAPDAQTPPEIDGGYVDTTQFNQPLAPYGRWVTVDAYGPAWVPANIAPGWRPYTMGHWAWTDRGWTWLSDEPFGWATYHYGRWLFTADFGWVWLPGSVWAPAWVDWRSGDGYVGWAPLPPRRGFRFAFSVSTYDNYAIPATYFNFCAERDFVDPYVYRHFEPVERNVTIINKTVHITNIHIENHRVVDKGIAVDRIERAAGHRIEPLSIRQTSRVADAHHVAGKELDVYRPAVTLKPEAVRAAKAAEVRTNVRTHANSVRTDSTAVKPHAANTANTVRPTNLTPAVRQPATPKAATAATPKAATTVRPNTVTPKVNNAVAPKVTTPAGAKTITVRPTLAKPVAPKTTVATPKAATPATPKATIVTPKAANRLSAKPSIATPKAVAPVTPKAANTVRPNLVKPASPKAVTPKANTIAPSRATANSVVHPNVVRQPATPLVNKAAPKPNVIQPNRPAAQHTPAAPRVSTPRPAVAHNSTVSHSLATANAAKAKPVEKAAVKSANTNDHKLTKNAK